jgi:hypothetical protein
MLNSIKLTFRVSFTLNHAPLAGFSDRKFMFFNYAIPTHSFRAPFETSIRIGNCSLVTAFHYNCAERCNYFLYFISLCLRFSLSLILQFQAMLCNCPFSYVIPSRI